MASINERIAAAGFPTLSEQLEGKTTEEMQDYAKDTALKALAKLAVSAVRTNGSTTVTELILEWGLTMAPDELHFVTMLFGSADTVLSRLGR